MINNDQNASEFPNAEEMITIETADNFTPVVQIDSNGKRRFFSFGNTKKEVVEKFYWNEREILDKEIQKGTLRPTVPFTDWPDEEDVDKDDFDDEPSYNNAVANPRGDQWGEVIGKTPSWDDINEDTVT